MHCTIQPCCAIRMRARRSQQLRPRRDGARDAAKADGRWDAAYAPMRSATAATVPDDLRAAIEASARARKTFRSIGRQNLFALVFRTNNMRTAAGRAKKIAALVAMLERGETIVPERPDHPRKPIAPKRRSGVAVR